MMKKNNLILIILFLIYPALCPAQEYNFINFSTEQGIVNPIIYDIDQTSLGSIVVATAGGLELFNGFHFKHYGTADGLPSNEILTTFVDKNDRIFIGSRNGAALFSHGKIKIINNSDSTKNYYIANIVERDSSIYFCSSKGFFIYKNGVLERIPYLDLFNDVKVYDILFLNDGKIWVATENGPYFFQNNTFNHSITSDKVYRILRHNDKLYFVTVNGLYEKTIGENNIKYFSTRNGLESNLIFQGLIASDDKLWLATDLGLSIYDGKKFQNIDRSEGLVTDLVYTVFEDADKNIWLGTSHGLVLFKRQKIYRFSKSDGLKAPVWNIFAENKEHFLLGTDGNGLVEYKNGKFKEVSLAPISPSTVWDIKKDKLGRYWLATESGVIIKDGNSVKKFRMKENELDDQIFFIYEDRNDNMWFSSAQTGLYKFDGKNVKVFNRDNGLNHNTVYQVKEDHDGNIWVASERGINKIVNDQIVPFPGDSTLMVSNITSVLFDMQGNVILGTYQRGLNILHFNEKDNSYSIDKITKEDGLNDNSIMFMERDINFNLWVGTNKGLNRIDLLEYYSTGEKIVTPFNEWDGFLGLETNQGSSYLSPDNILYYGTPRGMIKFDLSTFQKSAVLHDILLERIDVNYKPIYSYPNIESVYRIGNYISHPHLPPELNTLTFEFYSVDFDNPTLVMFSTKLEGLDKDFTPYQRDNTVTYPSLRPGNYIFKVKVKNRYGIEEEKVLEYPFTIKQPFYTTTWFGILVFILVASFLAWLYKIQVVDFKKTHKKLEKLYKERLEYENVLRQSEEDYRGLFEHAHNAIIISDPITYEIIDVNSAACKLYGYTKEEFLQMTLKDVVSDFEKAKKNVKEIRENGSVKDLEVIHKKKSGDLMTLSINAAISHYRNNEVIVAVHRDISAEKEAEQNLIRAKEAAEKSNKLKSEFLAQVSHEVRTPLNTILNAVALLEMKFEEDDAEIIFSFKSIRKAANRIIDTIGAIINMSEIRTGTYSARFDNIDINRDIIALVFHEFRPRAKDKGLDLVFEHEDESYIVNIDEFSVKQIFNNLIDNAIKYTNEGTIRIEERVEDAKLIVEVVDTGIGIDKNYLERIFEPFSQEEEGYTRPFDGTGLGMALVKNYCELNDLDIKIDSEKGKGTKVTLIFKSLKN